MFAVFHDEVARWCPAGITRILRSLLWCSRPFLSQNAPNCEKVEAGASRSQTTLSGLVLSRSAIGLENDVRLRDLWSADESV